MSIALRRATIAAGLSTLLLSGLAVASADPVAGAATGQTISVEEMTFDHGRVVSRTTRDIPLTSQADPGSGREKPNPAPRRTPTRLSARLQSELARSAADGSTDPLRVIVTFVDDQKVPRMSESAQARSAQIDELRQRRAPGYAQARAVIERLGGRVLDTHWLIKSVLAELPASAVADLAARVDVQYVESARGGEAPPADMDPGNDEADARALLGTDPYYNAWYFGSRVGILDTGVNNHTLLDGQTITSRADLAGSGSGFDGCNHGTRTASAITGGTAFGNDFRGIGAPFFDSWDIYDGCSLDPEAAIDGFEAAVDKGDKVIVAEIQATETEDDGIAEAADNAFDAGSVVIGAAGNFADGSAPAGSGWPGGSGSATSPGNARKALGIGAVDVESFALQPYSGRGPTGDGRIKPDLVAPTNVETGDAASYTSTSWFTGTSAATAQAGGTAAVFHQFLRGSASSVEPGHVYAGMIASGGHPEPFDNNEGAGKLKLPSDGKYLKSKVTIHDDEVLYVPMNVTASSCRLTGALWWAEDQGTHNDVDIALIDPSGTSRAVSDSIESVFELARVNGPLMAGTWKLRVKGYNVSGSQDVYVAGATCR